MTHDPIDTTGFKPATLTDQPQPMLIWAEIDALVIDRRYQRNVTFAGRRLIQRIADDFDWRKYQPILVAPTEGGKLAVVDGQHRAHAAAVAGLTAIPAMTVAMTLAEQARGFTAVNRDRVPINPLAIFRAALAAGDEWATATRDAVAAAGCEMATSNPTATSKIPRRVYAVNLVRKMVTNGEGEAVTAGLRAIAQSGQADEVEAYSGPVLAIWLPAIATRAPFLKLDLATAFDTIDVRGLPDHFRDKARQTGQSARAMAIQEVIDHLIAFRARAA